MLNEFYEFIAKKVNSFFQKAASDGTLLKGERNIYICQYCCCNGKKAS